LSFSYFLPLFYVTFCIVLYYSPPHSLSIYAQFFILTIKVDYEQPMMYFRLLIHIIDPGTVT
jgi:hypothetical protein